MTNFRQCIRRCLTRGVTLFISAFTLSAVSAQTTTSVSGRVIDDQGAPLAGTVVSQQGTNNATITDVSGNYSISVPGTATLDFSLAGYTAASIPVEGRRVVDVTMQTDLTMIEDVVVVGYGTVRKTDMTGAVAVLGDKKLNTVTSPRAEDMLNGKVPGVFVGSGSGQPGTSGVVIIRGKTSINSSTDPLWVVDGVIVGTTAGDLNPADIESMTILKDAASTAIYGSQGSNGVIIVTTKKGRVGRQTVSFSAKAGMSYMDMGNLEMMNSEQLYDLWNSFGNPEKFNTQSWWSEDLKKRDFNWKDQISQTGVTQDYNVSVRGGNETIRTYVSLGYYNETGAVKGYEYQKYSGRFNADWKVNKWLTVKPSVSFARRDTDSREHSVTAMYQNLPWNSPYNKDGSLVGLGADADPVWITQATTSSYLYNLQWNYSWNRYYETAANFDFNVKITDWLSFESVNSYRVDTRRYFGYTDPRSLNNSTGGSIRNIAEETNRKYFNQLLRFNKTFNDVHHVSAMAAYEWNDYYYDWFDSTKDQVAAGADNLNLATKPVSSGGNVSDWAMQSFFVNATYAYGNRYFAQASIRRDGSSKFGVNNRYGTFFSVSGSWNIHEENFFASLRNTVNQAKLRLSYGSTGNMPRSNYGSYNLYALDTGSSYNGANGALISGAAGNPDMTWETTYTTNLGLDLSFWNSRLNLSVDIYNKATSGLLWSTPLPSVWGHTSVYRNAGNVNNKGIEITLDGDIIRSKDWRWNVAVNFGSNRNKIVSLYNDLDELVAPGELNLAGIADRIFKIGYDMDTWYVKEWAGVDPETGRPQWYTNNADGRNITGSQGAALRIPMGSYTPKFYGGFNTSVNWKFIDLNAVFAYSVGGKIFNYSRREYDSDGAYVDRNQMVLQKGWNRWEKPGDVATHPQPLHGGNNTSNAISSRYLEDGSYLKLKSLTLGATLPIKSKAISDVRVYVTGENLLTFTKYSGVDPEVPVNNSAHTDYYSVVGNVGPGVYPGVKKVMFGVNLTF